MAGDVTGSTRAVAPKHSTGLRPVRREGKASERARAFSQSRFQTLPVPYLYFTWPGAKKQFDAAVKLIPRVNSDVEEAHGPFGGAAKP